MIARNWCLAGVLCAGLAVVAGAGSFRAVAATASGSVPLVVRATDGSVQDATVFTGVPFPPGTLFDERTITLTEAGRGIPRQVQVLSRYPDRSVRVALLGFRATVSSGRPLQAEVRWGGDPIPGITLPWARSPRVLALCPPEWYGRSGVFNGLFLAVQANPQFATFDARLASQFDRHCDPPSTTDPTYRPYYDHIHALYMALLRTGGPDTVPALLQTELSRYREAEIVHTGPYRGQFRAGGRVTNASPMLLDTIRRVYPLGLLEDYYFTGDRRSLEVALEVGDALLKDVYAQVERFPVMERQPGYLIQGLCALYEATLDRKYLDAARYVGEVEMDHQDAMAVKYPDQGGVEGQTGAFVEDANGQWSDPEESLASGAGSSWMTGLLCDGLIQLYWLTGDPRVRESVVRAADWLADAAFVPAGHPQNASRVDDFWYICRAADNHVVYPVLSPMLLQTLGFAYQATGDPRYLSTARRVLAPNNWGNSLKEFNQAMRTSGQGLYLLSRPSGTVPLSLAQAGSGADIDAPATPAGITVLTGGAGVQLRWQAAAGAVAYRVYRAPAEAGPYQLLPGSPAVPSFADGAAAGWYRVTSVDAAGNESLPGEAFPAVAGAAGTHSLSGRVTVSGRGLRGVAVAAGGRGAVTGEDGGFLIHGLAPGAVTVLSSRTGYRFAERAVTVPQGSPVQVESSTDFLFRDLLAPGWRADQSRATLGLTANVPVAEEQRSIALTIAASGGWARLTGPGLSTRGRSVLRFFLHGGAAGRQDLWLAAQVDGVDRPARRLRSYGTARRGAWTEVTIPLAALQASGGHLTGLTFSGRSAQRTAYVDFIRLQ